MEQETIILNQLTDKFSILDGTGTIPAERRIYLTVPSDIFMEVIGYAAHEMQFYHLCTITGLDSNDSYEFIYHISNSNGIVLSLKIRVPKENPVINTVLPIYGGAIFYERELEGILGVKVEGLPKGRQYPLPDNWPKGQYPLRKDWTPEMLQQNQ